MAVVTAAQLIGVEPIPIALAVLAQLIILICLVSRGLSPNVGLSPLRSLAALASLLPWILLAPEYPVLALGLSVTLLSLVVRDQEVNLTLQACSITCLIVALLNQAASLPAVAALVIKYLPNWYAYYRGTSDSHLPSTMPLSVATVITTLHCCTLARRQPLPLSAKCGLLLVALSAILATRLPTLALILLAISALLWIIPLAQAGRPSIHPSTVVTLVALGVCVGVYSLLASDSDSALKRPGESRVFLLESKSMKHKVWTENEDRGTLAKQLTVEPNFHLFIQQVSSSSSVETIEAASSIPDDLTGYTSLIFINPNAVLLDSQITRIAEFVKEGGRLLVLGDHTNLDYQAERTNPLLSHFGIQLRSDSAIPDNKNWKWSGRLIVLKSCKLTASPTLGLPVSIGCSLDLSGKAKPLVLGVDCYSDSADLSKNNGNFLGDTKWSKGEQSGILVLAASARLGKGEVLVFGDTSPFQNLSGSSAHELHRQVAAWVLGIKADSSWVESIGWLLLYVSGCFLMLSIVLPGVVTMAAGFYLAAIHPVLFAPSLPSHVLIENQGLGKRGYQPRAERGVSALAELVSAQGLLPLIDTLRVPDYSTRCVIRRLTQDEWIDFDPSTYEEFLKNGGTLVLFPEGYANRLWKGGNDLLGVRIVDVVTQGALRVADEPILKAVVSSIGQPLVGDAWTPVLWCGESIVGLQSRWQEGKIFIYGTPAPFLKAQATLSLGEWELLAASVADWTQPYNPAAR